MSFDSPRHSSLLRLVAMLVIGGCAWSAIAALRAARGPASYAAEGAVSLDGKPLENAVIQFVPLTPTPGKKTGAEIRAGQYAITSADGLMPGRYRVEIHPYVSPFASAKHTARYADSSPPKVTATPIPDWYNRSSILRVQANEGANRFDFRLTTSPPPNTKPSSRGK